MPEKIAIAEMMTIAFMFGIWGDLRRKVSGLDKCILLGIYLFGAYWFISVGRLFFLRTGEFYLFMRDIRVLILDILMGVASVIFLPKSYLYSYRSKKEHNFWVVPVCIMITLASALLCQFVRYRNVNSALYHCLLPEAMSVIGLIVWLELAILSHLVRKGTHEACKSCKDKLSVIVALAFVITVFAYPYLETFLSNSEEFTFTLKDILLYFIIFLTIVFCVTMAILTNLSNQIWEMAILGVFSFTLTAYMQALFLNKRLFLMDGVNRDWSVGIKISNILVWVGLFVGVFLFRYHCAENWKSILKFCCITIVAMQITGVLSLIIKNNGHFETRKESEYFSTNGLFETAAEENVIVFVLDKYDEKYMQEVLAEEPDFLEPLKGFVGFSDTVAQFSRTYPAITYMLTDHTFFNASSREEYINWAFDDCSFWEDLAEKKFHMYFYEEDASYIGKSVKGLSDNYVEQGKVLKREISPTGCIRSIHTMNCYKLMPYFLKDYFNLSGSNSPQLCCVTNFFK